MALRQAYKGHEKWFCIDNNGVNFAEKMVKAKNAIHSVLGMGTTGTAFYKKFLIKKFKN